MTQRVAIPSAVALGLAWGLVACSGGTDGIDPTRTGNPGGGAATGVTPTGGTTTGGSPASGGAPAGGTAGAPAELEWRQANLTHYESYPDPNSEECLEYNGCTWAGQFAALDGVMPEAWVMEHNIAAVHGDDFPTYRLKTLRLRQGDHEIDVVVYDYCSDGDCDGCCTANSAETGFLIDIEKYTMQRFGSGDGIVEWACLDC